MKGMSEKVLARQKARKGRRVWIISYLTFFAATLAINGYRAWHEHQRNTPTWMTAASLDGNLQERVTFIHPFREVPNRAIINGEAWDLTQVDHFSDSSEDKAGTIMAETDCENREIMYLPSDDKARLRENIMHEIFHAGDCLHGGDKWWNSPKDDDEHPGIYHLGEFMHSFLHDNRQFAEWLGEE